MAGPRVTKSGPVTTIVKPMSMDCRKVAAGEIAERYLRGDLSAQVQEAYELHYFECERCFRELRDLQSVQAALGGLSSSALVPSQPATAAHARWRHRWAWVGVAAIAASAAVVALLLVPGRREEPVARAPVVRPGPTAPKAEVASPADVATAEPPRPERRTSRPAEPRRSEVLARLARVTPPLYAARTFRGVGDEADQLFEQGMQQYVAGNFGAATPTLHQAAAEDPSRTDIAFFLAASELMEHRYAAATAGFEGVISRGDTPFVEEAHFYLAKACIGLGEVERARSALDAVIDRGGELAREARRLSAELKRLPET